jgi:hypothetical protein
MTGFIGATPAQLRLKGNSHLTRSTPEQIQ